ncbi:serine protease ea-like [Halictus rubicundus]|uniref:serine protease ea-like n=1 Tax=Halictus rubicundus TaxID=77578 RepID=UPI0040359BC8
MNLFVSSVFLQALILYSANAQFSGAGGPNCVTPNGVNGVCIGIRQCPVLFSIVSLNPVPPDSVQYLKQSHCGFEGRDPKVCCPPEQLRPTEDPFNNNPLLPTECGKDLSSRIVGGERTDIDEFPWMALLEYATPSSIRTLCGGVLITRRYVLTAAHCIKGRNNRRTQSLQSVRLGEYDTSTAVDCIKDGDVIQVCADEHISVAVEETIVHENYIPTSTHQRYDIALIRLSRDVPFTNYVQPICLPPNNSIGQKLVSAGWGQTENQESSSSNLKLKISLPFVERQQCQAVYRTAGVNLDPGQICAGGEKGKDTCKGDSGGPLMAMERSRVSAAKWTVVGVVSFGPTSCGMEGWPGIYTNVSHYVPWILSKLRP